MWKSLFALLFFIVLAPGKIFSQNISTPKSKGSKDFDEMYKNGIPVKLDTFVNDRDYSLRLTNYATLDSINVANHLAYVKWATELNQKEEDQKAIIIVMVTILGLIALLVIRWWYLKWKKNQLLKPKKQKSNIAFGFYYINESVNDNQSKNPNS